MGLEKSEILQNQVRHSRLFMRMSRNRKAQVIGLKSLSCSRKIRSTCTLKRKKFFLQSSQDTASLQKSTTFRQCATIQIQKSSVLSKSKQNPPSLLKKSPVHLDLIQSNFRSLKLFTTKKLGISKKIIIMNISGRTQRCRTLTLINLR